MDLVLIAHNLRSCHNVGSLLRTAEGMGVKTVYLTGYTPYPKQPRDSRLPHLADKISKQISKTSLGADESINIIQSDDVLSVLRLLKKDSYTVVALEQDERSVPLQTTGLGPKIALVLGRETEGIEPDVLMECDKIVEIPMFGKKESFNVVQAAAMAMYHFRFVKM